MSTKPLTFEQWATREGLNPRVYGSQTTPSGSYGWAKAAWNAARDRWTPVSKELPPEPCWCLVMLAPDNDWGLMSDTPLQVEFDAYKGKPKAFTCFYDFKGDEDITAAVLAWMRMPMPWPGEVQS